MIEIVQAELKHKDVVINLLTQFKEECYEIYDMETNVIYEENMVQQLGLFYRENISSKNCTIFLSRKEGEYCGIIIGNISCQFRNARVFVEVEDFFIHKHMRGGELATYMMDSLFDWAKLQGAKEVRLESGLLLERAHKFYENYGFTYAAKAYSKKF